MMMMMSTAPKAAQTFDIVSRSALLKGLASSLVLKRNGCWARLWFNEALIIALNLSILVELSQRLCDCYRLAARKQRMGGAFVSSPGGTFCGCLGWDGDGVAVMIAELAGWIAPAATMLAAMLTAANLGPRPTGWGFVVFTIGSLAWSTVAISSGQTNLLLTNGVLTLVNLFGVWRWLGQRVRYEDGSKAAASRSKHASVPDLFGVSQLLDAVLRSPEGKGEGVIVEVMARCDDARLAYVIVSTGGVGGVGETLRIVDPVAISFTTHGPELVEGGVPLTDYPPVPEVWPPALPPEAKRPSLINVST
jgi:hypothetical protein